MRIMFIKTSGGFAECIDLDQCMTIGEFFSRYMPHCDEMDYLIRVNSQPELRQYILKNDDRVTIIPVDVLGIV